MMRHLGKVVLAVGVAALLAGPSFGQGFGRGGNMLGFLLENKDFQKELKLTDEQVTKAKAAAEEVFKKHADDFKDLPRTAEGRQKGEEIGRQILKETKKAWADILDAKQIKRLDQITFQLSINFRGPSAYMEEDVQKSLKLNDDQKDQIKTIADDLNKDRTELFKDAQGDPAKLRDAFQKMQGLNKEANEKVTKVLSAEQKKTLNELKGDPFELQFPPARP